jgi:very-short-patch-repair endonuclease
VSLVKLNIELDGGQHNEVANRERDARRTEFLESRGYRVVRIWNVELFADPGLVVEYILALARERGPQSSC